MSTMMISPRSIEPSVPTLRLTRRGRLVVLGGFILVVAALMIAFGGLATATHDSGTPESVRIVTVAPGDTLYGIAGEVAGPGEIRETVAHIKSLNSMSGSSLQVGDKIAVPVG